MLRRNELPPSKPPAFVFTSERLLKAHDVKQPVKTLREIETLIEEADKRKESSAAWAYRAMRAVILEEQQTNEYLYHPEQRKDQAEEQSVHEGILVAYKNLLERLDQAPREIAPHFTPQDLQSHYSDELTNEPFLLGQALSPQHLSMGRQLLWRISYLVGEDGKRAEHALIGLLRYGPHYYRHRSNEMIPRINEMAPEEAVRMLTPALFVKHTMPREDYYNVGVHHGCDLVWHVPGFHPTAFSLKTGIVPKGIRALELPASVLIEAWERIGNLGHAVSPLELEHWREKYRSLVEQIGRQVSDIERKELEKILCPSGRAVPKKREGEERQKEVPSLDTFAILVNIQKHWSAIQQQIPSLVGMEAQDVYQHISFVRDRMREVYKQDPEAPVWQMMQAWFKENQSARAARRQARG